MTVEQETAELATMTTKELHCYRNITMMNRLMLGNESNAERNERHNRIVCKLLADRGWCEIKNKAVGKLVGK